MTLTPEKAGELREKFPDSMIGKLPKAGMQLDFVGHAAVTDRLLRVDPEWTWEPVAFDEQGAPLIQSDGRDMVMWIRLTVCGHTKLGVGSVPVKAFDPHKQLVSDALKNAAMRFGVALDLWSKEELSEPVFAEPVSKPSGGKPKKADDGRAGVLRAEALALPDDLKASFKTFLDGENIDLRRNPTAVQLNKVEAWLRANDGAEPFEVAS